MPKTPLIFQVRTSPSPSPSPSPFLSPVTMEKPSIVTYIESNGLPLKASVRRGVTRVWNQKQYPICNPLATADLLSIFHTLINSNEVTISPQELIDFTEFDDPYDAFTYLMEHGIHTVDDYPFIRMKCPNPTKPDGACYTFPKTYMVLREDKIPEAIVQSVAGDQFGCQCPVLGDIHVRPPEGLPSDHAVVVTGYDFTSPNPAGHFWEIKNTYGLKWGEGGYGRIAIDSIDCIIVPSTLR